MRYHDRARARTGSTHRHGSVSPPLVVLGYLTVAIVAMLVIPKFVETIQEVVW